MPTRRVEADFFSSLSSMFVGDQAFAETSPNTVSLPKIGSNSQNIALLQANVSSISITNNKDNKDTSADLNSDTNIVSGTSLLPATGPLGVSDGKDASVPSLDETSVYVVRKGDLISKIADMFNVSVDTILWANNMKKGDKLSEGDILFILPITGVEHTVLKGQTLQSIAKLYKADINDIIQSNDITIDTMLAVGDKIIIPNATKSEENGKPLKNVGASVAKDKLYYENHPMKNLAGYYINPVPGYRLSQGLHDRTAVDLAISKGTPIHAAAEGVVKLARMGWNGGYGNFVIIAHPNGTETVYAHQSKLATTTGAHVYQGEVIGYVGSTGHSTGPHLHFEVHGAQNPGIDASWKY